MSEQTPESTVNATSEDGFSASESEPSMEDILASIRKIISDDADPLPLDGPDVEPIEDDTIMAAETVETSDEAFDLDSLLGELDVVETSSTEPSSFADAVGISDLPALEDDLTIPEIDAETATIETVAVDQDEDDMDRLMNELLIDMDEPSTPSQPEDLLAAAMTPQAGSGDGDMDIVKSLMADLTDDDVELSPADAFSDDLDLEAMMNEIADFDVDPEPEAELESEIASETDELDAMEDDIFDSILDMTLDDEIEAFDAQAEADAKGPSLADIAAAAEAEAIVDPASVVKTTAVRAAETQTSDDQEPVVDLADASVAPVPTQSAKPAPSEMEIPMPSALRSDAILDDVTEQATMTAFAELNQIVEDKAILSERGPRIGDLVQDALKPMLKEWLDENIQGIVERAVAKEVSRIATGK